MPDALILERGQAAASALKSVLPAACGLAGRLIEGRLLRGAAGRVQSGESKVKDKGSTGITVVSSLEVLACTCLGRRGHINWDRVSEALHLTQCIWYIRLMSN